MINAYVNKHERFEFNNSLYISRSWKKEKEKEKQKKPKTSRRKEITKIRGGTNEIEAKKTREMINKTKTCVFCFCFF